MRTFNLILLAGIMVFTGSGCAFTSPTLPSDPEEADTGSLATAVALTLAAAESAEPSPESPGTDPISVPLRVLRVAYVDSTDLWLWTEGTAAVKLYDNPLIIGDLRLSDDGQIITFMLVDSNSLPNHLMAINTDGSNLRILINASDLLSLTRNPNAVAVGPNRMEFIPGSHTLAFNTRLYIGGTDLILENTIQLVNADDGSLTTLDLPGESGQFFYSPDGTQVAIVTPTDISLMNADGSNWRDAVLIYDRVITYTEAPYYATPRWSADSSQLRVVIPSADTIDPDATNTLYDLPLDGSPAVSLGSTTTQPQLFNPESSLSPDMSTVAITRELGDPGNRTIELHFADPSTGLSTFYHTSSYIYFDNWSPDGRHFVFTIDGSRFLGELGAEFGPLAGLSDVRSVVWVDSTRFIFSNGGSGVWQLQLGSIDGLNILIASPTANFVVFAVSY